MQHLSWWQPWVSCPWHCGTFSGRKMTGGTGSLLIMIGVSKIQQEGVLDECPPEKTKKQNVTNTGGKTKPQKYHFKLHWWKQPVYPVPKRANMTHMTTPSKTNIAPQRTMVGRGGTSLIWCKNKGNGMHHQCIWPNEIIFHQPRFPWNSRDPISLPLRYQNWGPWDQVGSCEVA